MRLDPAGAESVNVMRETSRRFTSAREALEAEVLLRLVREGVDLPKGRGFINYRLMRTGPEPVNIRMLRHGNILQKIHRFLSMATALAQLLHCVTESDACPIGSCADADSRSWQLALP